MKISSLMILCITLMLGGCLNTTGKDIAPKFIIEDNENCVIYMIPTSESLSGDAENNSANDTDLQDLLTIPLADAMEAAITKGVDTSIIEKVTPVIVPSVNAEDPVPVEDPTTPVVENDLIGTYSCKNYEDKSTCRTPVDFSKNDFPITFVFDNDCGSFTILTAVSDNRDTDEYDRDGYVYFSYEKGSPAVFTPKGCVATSVSAYRTTL